MTQRLKPAEKRRARQEVASEEQTKRAPVSGKTAGQKRYLQAINGSETTICYGPMGTGKTYIPAALAAEYVMVGKAKRIILCRPAVEGGGEKIGFLPGELEQKMAPWTAPIMDVLEEKLGKGKVNAMVAAETIKVIPFAYMRGRTWSDAFVIADEMQNATPEMMRLITGRPGPNTKLVISGDLKQCDLKTPTNGLAQIVSLAERREMPGVSIVELTHDDIVRSEQCRVWAEAWEWYDEERAARAA